MEREALAVVWACEHFHLYVFGAPGEVITDHKPLLGIYGNPRAKTSARLERWALRLIPYDMHLNYKSDKTNPADYMSRHPETTSTSRSTCVAKEYVHFLAHEFKPVAMGYRHIFAILQRALRARRPGVEAITKSPAQESHPTSVAVQTDSTSVCQLYSAKKFDDDNISTSIRV